MLKRNVFATILLIATTIAYGQHNTWFTISNGWSGQGNSLLIHKDTVIVVCGETRGWKNFIHVNYHDIHSGQLLKTDTLDITRITGDSTVNNGFSYERSNYTAIIDSFGNLQVGLDYGDKSVGTTGNWQTGIFNVNPYQKTNHELNTDTFATFMIQYSEINGIRYALILWTKPVSKMLHLRNYNLVKLRGENEVVLVWQQLNPYTSENSPFTHITNVYADKQNKGNLFLKTFPNLCWNASTVQCMQANIVKIDTNGNTLWQSRPNNNDSVNSAYFQMVQKPNGNILCSWSDYVYTRIYSTHLTFNENTTVWFAEIDYETGKVLWRKNIRQFLEWRMIPQTTDNPKEKNRQDVYFQEAQLTEDGHAVWAGYRYIQYTEPTYWKRIPALLKTDLEANPVWYREHDLFPDDTGDKGMEVFNLVQTPDNGFILAGLYDNRFGEFSGGEFWQKTALLRLDSKGCLTPGCDATDNVRKIQTSSSLCFVYPNPARSEINISYPENMLHYWNIKLTDMTGKTVYSSEEASPSISVQNLPAGIYFLHLQQQNNYHYETHKISIEP